jgi:hypothetical protein
VKIFELNTEDDQAYLHAPPQVIERCIPEPPGSLLAGWSAPVFELVRDDEFRSNLRKTDFPILGHDAPVLSARAVDRLHAILTPCGELLPIRCSNDPDEFFLFNVTRIINPVDMKQSKFFPLPSGALGHCEHLVLDPKKIPADALFFKNTQLGNWYPIYATEAAVDAVKKSRLTGYAFPLAWSDE